VLATGVLQARMRLDKVRLLVYLVKPATFLELAGVIVMLVQQVRKKHQEVSAHPVQQESTTITQDKSHVGPVKRENMLPLLAR